MEEIEKELQRLLMKVKEESEKAGLKQHSENKDHGICSHHFTANKWGKQWKQQQTLLSWVSKSLQMVTAAMKLKDTYSLEENL